jgi:Cu-Zn family superoxide dismutase
MIRTLTILILITLGLGLAAAESAVAVLQPTAGNDTAGTISFEAVEGGVQVTAEVTGLEPNATHAFHIHQYGDLRSEDGTSAGGHYNPQGHEHGLPEQEHRHAGDLGNLEANADGVATKQMVVDNISIDGDMNPIIGRSMVVHAESDKGTQPTGDAGPRIATGVIGYANPDLQAE